MRLESVGVGFAFVAERRGPAWGSSSFVDGARNSDFLAQVGKRSTRPGLWAVPFLWGF